MAAEIATRDQSLSKYAADLEAICTEIELCDGELPKDLMQRFEYANLALQNKCDRWIGYVDAMKAMIGVLEQRSKRAATALKTARGLQEYLENGMKAVIETNPNLTFKGESGTIYLHGQAETIDYAFKWGKKTVDYVVDPAFIQMEPSVSPYLTTVTYQVIDRDRLKADLKIGVPVTWAKLVKPSYVAVKGS